MGYGLPTKKRNNKNIQQTTKMKTAPIYSIEGEKIGEIELPPQFNEEFRPDLIKRAVLAIQNSKRQQYGSSPFAGKRASAELSKRRRKYRGCYGIGIARTPRKIISRRGTRFNWVGAFAPNTVGGRRAHPPKSSKQFIQKLNKKERRKALRSAISRANSIIIENKFEQLKKTSEVAKALKALSRATAERKSPPNSVAKKPLIISLKSRDCPLFKSAQNIAEIIEIKMVNTHMLAPGTNAGRMVIWIQNAIENMAKENLFT